MTSKSVKTSRLSPEDQLKEILHLGDLNSDMEEYSLSAVSLPTGLPLQHDLLRITCISLNRSAFQDISKATTKLGKSFRFKY